jgi:hypothetical protein
VIEAKAYFVFLRRYMTAIEGVWLFFKYEMKYHHFAFVQLTVHLPDEQPVIWHRDQLREAMERDPKMTPLLAFFEFCKKIPADPRLREIMSKMTFANACDYLRWNVKTREWQWRQRCPKPTIGVLGPVSPKNRERYFLRMLLRYVMRPQCYEDVRTYNGVVYDTNYDACCARGILKNDDEYKRYGSSAL